MKIIESSTIAIVRVGAYVLGNPKLKLLKIHYKQLRLIPWHF
ncbi:MAG: hypothetical protein AVDCRST_MAG96-3525 [uncultured Segetibacter sp.]|uniref:Uncharacterized protein n=1 Tax=uncultured Segetibacter sp. TaxID=481133 RepID=A0A6J4TS49_9BACT|nr:MAG: hypothetical protein AVDCRST_MAG96-3525 [uncultured Segetibacter sp.]